MKIATWNLCLGLSNKKDLVCDYLAVNNVNICCLQETEIPMNCPEEVLDCNNYVVELEQNTEKKRAGIYIQKNTKYVRRFDLEKVNCHIVVIDVTACLNFRIICIYRSFRPQGLISPTAFFETQVSLIRAALTKNCYVLGDFNLDARMDMRPDYDHKIPLSILTDFALENNLIQIVTETTWSRIINGIKKESLLDHVYANNIETIINVSLSRPIFGDHALVMVEIVSKSLPDQKVTTSRNWKNYDAEKVKCNLLTSLSRIDEKCIDLCVQVKDSFWVLFKT